MEEILASIRRIIADDSAPPPRLTHAQDDLARVSHVSDEPAEEPTSSEKPISLSALHEDGPLDAAKPPEAPASEPALELSRHPLAPPEVAGHGSVGLEPEPPIPPLHNRGPHDPTLHGADLHEPIPQDFVPQVEAPVAPAAAERLVSAAAESAVTGAFNALAASRFVDNSEQLMGLVREMIRPLVKAWVDEHLPGMVERVVVAEIERMARR